jgi:hypothetical protein
MFTSELETGWGVGETLKSKSSSGRRFSNRSPRLHHINAVASQLVCDVGSELVSDVSPERDPVVAAFSPVISFSSSSFIAKVLTIRQNRPEIIRSAQRSNRVVRA